MTLSTQAHLVIEAVVQVGAEQTRYLRCGRGPAVVVVLTDDAGERMSLVRAHAVDGTAIAPIPSADSPLDVWLPGVLDGLGLDMPTVVLSTRLAPFAARLVAACGDRLAAVLTAPPHRNG